MLERIRALCESLGRRGRITWAAMLCVLLVVGPRLACQRGWRHDGQPLQLPAIDAELFFVQAPLLARAGPGRLAVVRAGSGATFVPHTYQDEGMPAPVHIEEWAKRLGAPVVFNAGQFDERLHHLGWLKGNGRWLEAGKKGTFQGLLVSGPVAGGEALPHSQIVDLAQDPDEEAQPSKRYNNVVQSMMLLDARAQARVRDSALSACRTVLAEDAQGRMLVIVSEGAITLHDFAAWLPHSGLQIVRAMNLDGGAESQMAIRTDTAQLALFGKYGHERLLSMRPPLTEAPLPAVVAIVPRAP